MNRRQWSHSLLQRQLAQGVCQEKGQFFSWDEEGGVLPGPGWTVFS